MAIFIGLLVISCSDDSDKITNIDKSNELEYTTLDTEGNDIGYLDFSEVNSIIQNIEYIVENDSEEDEKILLIQSELAPFTEIGHNIINHINNNYDIADLIIDIPEEDHYYITNPNDEDLAMIGFVLNLANGYGYNTASWGQDEILDCLAVAVGVKGLKDLVMNTKTLAAFEAATAKQTLRLLGKIGSRYLGWVGVALMVRDFANCMNHLN